MNEKLRDAIDRLASLFDLGELQVATSPSDFIHHVCDEIIELRKNEQKSELSNE